MGTEKLKSLSSNKCSTNLKAIQTRGSVVKDDMGRWADHGSNIIPSSFDSVKKHVEKNPKFHKNALSYYCEFNDLDAFIVASIIFAVLSEVELNHNPLDNKRQFFVLSDDLATKPHCDSPRSHKGHW